LLELGSTWVSPLEISAAAIGTDEGASAALEQAGIRALKQSVDQSDALRRFERREVEVEPPPFPVE
jgi:hypothetical protein